jgi:DNA-binding transcriptional LysR family regulator
MDLRQIECFLAVAEHLHFGRAAEELSLGQPTVSESIRRLERELGAPLFDRSTRRVTLTPLGVSFRTDASVAYEGVRQAYDRGRSFARGGIDELVVGYAGDPGSDMVELVTEFQALEPEVILSLRTMTTQRLMRRLHEGRVHAAICWLPELDETLTSLPLGHSVLAAVVPTDHPLASRPSVTFEDLAGEPLIAWPRLASPRLYDRFCAAMNATGRPWTLVGAATGPENVVARVVSGFGIAITIESYLPTPLAGSIVRVPISGEAAEVARVLVWSKRQPHQALDAFVTLAANHFGAEPASAGS